MNTTTLYLIQIVGALIGAAYFLQLLTSFSYMNSEELRRRAATGSQPAQRVLMAREYGLKLWITLWLMVAFMIVIIINAIASFIPNLWNILISMVILVFLFFILPRSKWFSRGLTPAARIGPLLAAFLNKIQIVFNIFKPFKLGKRLSNEIPLYIHSKENLIDIMRSLKSKTSQPQVIADLELAVAVLKFNTKKIKTIMTPIDSVKTVKFDQKLSPRILSDLHKSQLSAFPVIHKDDQYSGILYLRDVQKQTKQSQVIQDIMQEQVYYLNIEMSLNVVVDAFLRTQQSSFLVVNQAQAVRGIISINDVLNCYFSEKQLGAFSQYENLNLVADYQLNPAAKPKKSKN